MGACLSTNNSCWSRGKEEALNTRPKRKLIHQRGRPDDFDSDRNDK